MNRDRKVSALDVSLNGKLLASGQPGRPSGFEAERFGAGVWKCCPTKARIWFKMCAEKPVLAWNGAIDVHVPTIGFGGTPMIPPG